MADELKTLLKEARDLIDPDTKPHGFPDHRGLVRRIDAALSAVATPAGEDVRLLRWWEIGRDTASDIADAFADRYPRAAQEIVAAIDALLPPKIVRSAPLPAAAPTDEQQAEYQPNASEVIPLRDHVRELTRALEECRAKSASTLNQYFDERHRAEAAEAANAPLRAMVQPLLDGLAHIAGDGHAFAAALLYEFRKGDA